MSNLIKKQDAATEYFFKEGCFIIETSNSEDDSAASVVRARVEPGQQTRWHWLDATFERYAIISGCGRVEVGDSPATQVTVGDVVLIPPGTRQRIHNTGKDDLVFFAICTPPFQAANYHSDD